MILTVQWCHRVSIAVVNNKLTPNLVLHNRFGIPLVSSARMFKWNRVVLGKTSCIRLDLSSVLTGCITDGMTGNLVRNYSKEHHDGESVAYTKKAPSVAYFIHDEDWALKALESVNLQNTEENWPPLVLLPNPGDSILTRLLLEMTNCSVVTWEPRETFFSHLQALTDDFRGRHFNTEKSFVKERDFESIVNDYFSHVEKAHGNVLALCYHVMIQAHLLSCYWTILLEQSSLKIYTFLREIAEETFSVLVKLHVFSLLDNQVHHSY